MFTRLIFQPAVVTPKRQVVLHLPSQHHLGILQGLIIQQPVQFCPLCRGVAVLVLYGDAVDDNGGAIREQGFHPVGVHVVAAGKQFRHNSILQDLIFDVRSLEPMPSSRCRMKWFLVCPGVSARFLHGFCTVFARFQNVQRVQIVAKSDKGCRNSRFKICDVSQRNDVET